MPRARRAVVLCYALALFVAVVTGIAARAQHPLAVAAWADLAATIAVFAFSVTFANASFYDPYWSAAPPALALWYASRAEEGVPEVRQALVIALVAIWAVRLTWNWARGWTGLAHEDWRYARIRERTGRLYPLANFLGIHLFPTVQVFAGCLALWPALAVGARPLGALDALAFAVTAGAIALEGRADQELRRFRLAPGRRSEDILDTGLWRLSRHPNYLGEMGFWWGLWLFGLAADPRWWWTVVGPGLMTAMFAFGTIPMIETRMREKRPGWEEHARRVPIVPRPF